MVNNNNISKNKQPTKEEIQKKEEQKLRRLELNKLEIQYRISKKAAKKEERLDFDGEENVSITGREKFFEVLQQAYKLGKLISEKDLSLIKNALYTHHEFIDKDKLKFIVDIEYRNGGLVKVEETIDDFLSLLRDTKYYKPIQNYKQWLRIEKNSEKIKKLRSSGCDTAQIAEKLNITSAEVKVFSYNQKKMPELFEEETK